MGRRLSARRSSGLNTPRSKTLKIRNWHAHGCAACKRRYTDACDQPLSDGFCSLHRAASRRDRVFWDVDMDPIDCCFTHMHPADHLTRERYALGGTGPWFICKVCARTSFYDPAAYTPPEPTT